MIVNVSKLIHVFQGNVEVLREIFYKVKLVKIFFFFIKKLVYKILERINLVSQEI